jgi:hypothetical protein
MPRSQTERPATNAWPHGSGPAGHPTAPREAAAPSGIQRHPDCCTDCCRGHGSASPLCGAPPSQVAVTAVRWRPRAAQRCSRREPPGGRVSCVPASPSACRTTSYVGDSPAGRDAKSPSRRSCQHRVAARRPRHRVGDRRHSPARARDCSPRRRGDHSASLALPRARQRRGGPDARPPVAGRPMVPVEHWGIADQMGLLLRVGFDPRAAAPSRATTRP